jgi:energy-coupling factor transporter ATP-binding protein EcfA2
MQLVSFSYNTGSWKLNDLNLQAVNLIVGKNANGKSRALSAIDLLVGTISQKKPVAGTWKVRFQTRTGENFDYSVACKISGWPSPQITSEMLIVDGKPLLERKGDSCRVFSVLTKKWEEFTPPVNQLVLHVRRDIKAYPSFEQLIGWANNSYGFRFGTISPLNALSGTEYDFMNPVEDLVDMFRQLNVQQKQQIITLLKEMGYEITEIKASIRTDIRLLEVTENGILKPIPHMGLSQGMFRIVALLVYFIYLVRVKKPQLITIDDLGEGLDYLRVVKLGKFIFESCQQEEVQLIATSNDGFLMNVVPIEYWNVLRRNGTEIVALNEKNNPELFENFAFTGLSNFDFFSSDYIDSKLK